MLDTRRLPKHCNRDNYFRILVWQPAKAGTGADFVESRSVRLRPGREHELLRNVSVLRPNSPNLDVTEFGLSILNIDDSMGVVFQATYLLIPFCLPNICKRSQKITCFREMT